MKCTEDLQQLMVDLHTSPHVTPTHSTDMNIVQRNGRIGSMAGGRCYCLVVSPSPDKIIIVGGRKNPFLPIDDVEECFVTL